VASMLTKTPITPARDEGKLLHELDLLNDLDQAHVDADGRPTLTLSEGRTYELPTSLYKVVLEAAHAMALGQAVAVVPVDTSLSTQEVAELLGVSRPHVVKLMETGQLRYTRPGKHRKASLSDVLTYRDREAVIRREALDRLAELSQDRPFV
jgi:excisionase family DNA binding protein